MKKKLALLLVAALTAGMLAACGSDAEGDGGESQKENQEEDQEEPEETGEVTTVKFWNGDSGMKEFMDEMVEQFNSTIGKENNVQIEMEHVESGDYDQQLSVAFQNGVQPDLVLVRPANIGEYVEKGYLMPLDEVSGIEQTVADSNASLVIGENAWQGKLYMIPTGARTVGLAYNKDMFVAAGIVDENGEAKPPATFEEMVECAKLLTDESKQQYGFCAPVGWGAFTGYYVAAAGQSSTGLINGNYNYQTGEYDFEGYRPMAEALLQMKADGSIYPGAEGLDNDPARARFAEGNIGMMMTAQWDCAVWNDQFPAKCDWGVAPVPVEDENNAYLQMGSSSYSYAIASKAIEEGREEAVALVFNYFYGGEMAIEKAEQGMEIPWSMTVYEQCDFSNSPKGWEDFCELRKISSQTNYATKSVDLDGLDTADTDFVNSVWSGEMSLDEWIPAMTERYNEGAQRFIDNAAEETAKAMEERVDPNMDISR